MKTARRHGVAAAALSALAGLLLSVLPHCAEFLRTGDSVWLSGTDEVYYLQFAGAAARAGSARLLDPAQVAPKPTSYASLPLLPGIVTARVLGVEPIGVGFFWRAWAGALVGFAWFFLLRSILGGPWVALAAAVILMSDAGMLYGWLGLKHCAVLARGLSGDAARIMESVPVFLPQWRIINPALTLPFLLAFLFFLRRAALEPKPRRVAAAAAAFGTLFYAYFFYWTAAGLALLLAAVMDRARSKTYLRVAVLGTLFGLPALALQAATRAEIQVDYLHRLGLLARLPHMPGLLLPKLALILLAACLWAIRRRPDLLCLWTTALAGILLANEHLLTGLWIGNDHWAYAWGPALSALVIALVFEKAAKLRRAPWILGGLCAAHLAGALWMRSLEAIASGEAARFNGAYRQYRTQRVGVAPLTPKGVMAGPPDFVDLAVLLEDQRPLFSYASILSPSIANEELGQRLALNAYLSGTTRRELLRDREKLLGGYSLDTGPGGAVDLGVLYDAAAKDPGALLRRFNVGVLALPAGGENFSKLPGWRLLQDGPYWKIWNRGN